MQLCPAGIGHRDQGGLSTLGGEIHREYTPAREDVWSYLHVFSFTDLKRRLNSAFCSGRTTVTDLHSPKIVILPLERYIKKNGYVFMDVHTCTCMYTFSCTYISFYFWMYLRNVCPEKTRKPKDLSQFLCLRSLLQKTFYRHFYAEHQFCKIVFCSLYSWAMVGRLLMNYTVWFF